MSTANLEIVDGPARGRRIPLDRPMLIGRAADADIVLEDSQVSRRHARLSPSGDGAIVEDLGSSNGTFINHQQIHAPAELTFGAELLVGVTVLELRTPREVERGTSGVRPLPLALNVPA